MVGAATGAGAAIGTGATGSAGAVGATTTGVASGTGASGDRSDSFDSLPSSWKIITGRKCLVFAEKSWPGCIHPERSISRGMSPGSDGGGGG